MIILVDTQSTMKVLGICLALILMEMCSVGGEYNIYAVISRIHFQIYIFCLYRTFSLEFSLHFADSALSPVALYPLTKDTQGVDVIGQNNPIEFEKFDGISWVDGPTGNATHA